MLLTERREWIIPAARSFIRTMDEISLNHELTITLSLITRHDFLYRVRQVTRPTHAKVKDFTAFFLSDLEI